MTIYKRLPRKLKKGIRSLRSCRPRSKWQRKAYNCIFKPVKTLAEIERRHQDFLETIPSGGLVVAAACDRNFYNFPKGKGKLVVLIRYHSSANNGCLQKENRLWQNVD